MFENLPVVVADSCCFWFHTHMKESFSSLSLSLSLSLSSLSVSALPASCQPFDERVYQSSDLLSDCISVIISNLFTLGHSDQQILWHVQTFTNRHHHTSAGCFNCFECLNNSICDHFNILADSFIFNLIMNICQVWNGSYRTDACAITSNFIHKHSRKLHDIYTSLATGSFLIFITNWNYIIFIKSLIFKYIQLYPHTVYRS